MRGRQWPAAASFDKPFERETVSAAQSERACNETDGVPPGDVGTAALQLADAAWTDTGAFGQLLLRQVRRAATVAQELAKFHRGIAH